MMQDKSKVDSITQHRAQNQGSMGKKCIIFIFAFRTAAALYIWIRKSPGVKKDSFHSAEEERFAV